MKQWEPGSMPEGKKGTSYCISTRGAGFLIDCSRQLTHNPVATVVWWRLLRFHTSVTAITPPGVIHTLAHTVRQRFSFAEYKGVHTQRGCAGPE